MTHQKLSFHLALILLLAFLVACTAPAPNPVPVPTKTPEATLEPTAIPVIIITPIPLPTAVPNQAELIKKATRDHPVDFVIDTQQLKNGVVPWWFYRFDNWYKYMSSDGTFSVLMHGGIAPKETTLKEMLGPSHADAKVVKADYLMLDNQAVTYFQNPALISGELTPEQFIDSFDFAETLRPIAKVEVISDKRIQLNGFPGRDVLLENTSEDDPQVKIKMHVRFYVVGNMVYQLTYVGSGDPSSHEVENRFLDSFTLNDTAPRG